MKKIYFIKCIKYRKFENHKVSYIFNEKLVLFIICGKCGSIDNDIFKEEEPTKKLKILGQINNKLVNVSCTSF